MKKSLKLTVSLLTLTLLAFPAFAKEKKIDGKKEFEEHCASCHKDGGNIVNPAKTLKKADLAANGVKKWQDIVGKMRNPGPGMNTFDKKEVSDKEARAIAEYILKTFK